MCVCSYDASMYYMYLGVIGIIDLRFVFVATGAPSERRYVPAVDDNWMDIHNYW